MILANLTARTRIGNIGLWSAYSDTIIKHIIKILVIYFENPDVWAKEIENHIVWINKQNYKKELDSVFYQEVIDDITVTELQDIKDLLESAVNDYLKSPNNFKHRVFIRRTNLTDVLETVNKILQLIVNQSENKKQLKILTNKFIKKTINDFWDTHNQLALIKSIRELKPIIK